MTEAVAMGKEEIEGLTDYARKAAMCIYIAVEKIVADDISSTLLKQADALETLLRERDEALEKLGECSVGYDTLKGELAEARAHRRVRP